MANKIVKNNKKQQKSAGLEISGQLLEYVLAAVLLAVCVIVPLYLKNGYYQVGDAKFAAYKYIMIAGLMVLMALLVLYFCFWIKEKPVFRASVTDYFVLAYLAIVFLSVFAGGFYDQALWGYPGWCMGLMSQISFVLLYFFVSRYGKYWKVVLWVLCATSVIVFVLGILNRLMIDPLGYYKGIDDYYKTQFLSTLGQATWYASFLVVVLPIGMGVYMYTQKTWIRVVSGIYTFIGFCTLMTQNSDSGYFAMIGFVLVFFWFAVEELPKLYRFFEMAALFLAAGQLMRLMLVWKPNTLIYFDQMTRIFMYTKLPWILFVLIVIICAALKVAEKKWEYSVRIAKFIRNVIYALLAVLAVLAVALLILNAHEMLPQELSQRLYYTYFNWNDAWGNGRGQTWIFTAQMFADESFIHKLLGVGPDCYSAYALAYNSERLQQMWGGSVLTNAHNEWFNMLINAGILGATAYIGIFISAVKRFTGGRKETPLLVGIAACVVSYMAYNFFCYQQVLCTPFIFILMGMGEYFLRGKRNKISLS